MERLWSREKRRLYGNDLGGLSLKLKARASPRDLRYDLHDRDLKYERSRRANLDQLHERLEIIGVQAYEDGVR